MGTVIAAARRRAPRRGYGLSLAYGAALVSGGAAILAGIGCLLERFLDRLPTTLKCLATAGLFKTTIGLRGLGRAAKEVQVALESGDLPEGRRLAAWHLVSRDTSALTAPQVAAATVESVAENSSDGVIGPLLFFALGGLPGALVYRWVNTCDSMLGYRDPEREWLGKGPARLDDLFNLVPARLTAALLTFAAWIAGEDARGAWRIWRRDAGKTESPNAGHPMSAMAGALGVELEKAGHYRLGAGQRSPEAADIGRSARLMRLTAFLASLLASFLLLRGLLRRRL
jgi:adenosylcobinamide-phosphate synthase